MSSNPGTGSHPCVQPNQQTRNAALSPNLLPSIAIFNLYSAVSDTPGFCPIILYIAV
ncbi:uncharacterized protein K444DRAFT_620279 [Hyaloscypha bicolor E]|uniref:Uncharacterized protein n=1 Tax=Hyaloscypha bicolor E TaxID=1095630 RepID=A0A2J6SK28_9HELO|nr:uncharacterized protein K444DRAFT_620279 [Hyaloscypha bicolor E]PMD51116.1 hypothetical protein K444DRAFT_620279 [Hyaloscypha bicolor E]